MPFQKIKHLISISALFPILLVCMGLCSFFLWQFYSSMNVELVNQGWAIVRQLTPASEYALLTRNERLLQGLVNSSMVNQQISGLAFFDRDGKLAAYRGTPKTTISSMNVTPYKQIEYSYSGKHTLRFIAPIVLAKVNIYEPQTHGATATAYNGESIIGWLVLNLDTSFAELSFYQVITVSILFCLLAFIIGFLCNAWLARRLVQPFTRLAKSLELIRQGHSDYVIVQDSQGEMGDLERDVAYLQHRWRDLDAEFNVNLEEATRDLQQSLLTLEEMNVALDMTRKQALAQSQLKSEFIANMSHEIRSPMNGIIGFTNLLKDTPLSATQLEYLDTIQKSGEGLLGIINDILDYSKIEAGQLQLDHIPMDIRQTIDEVVALLAPLAHKKSIELIPLIFHDVPEKMLGDQLRFKQIMTNLIGNAIKFTEQGSVVIRVDSQDENELQYRLRVQVTDTGIGLTEAEQKKLFSAFRQADTSITRRFGGTGLGLVICEKLVKVMGGEIQLKSSPGEGSTFSFSINVDKLSSSSIFNIENSRFQGTQALVFEEHPMHRRTLAEMLKLWHVPVIEVLDEYELVRRAEEERYPLIIIGTHQPQLNSSRLTALCTRLKAIESSRVLLLLNTTSQALLEEAAQCGVDKVVSKPISHYKFYDILCHWFLAPGAQPVPKTRMVREEQPFFISKSFTVLVAEDNPVNLLLFTALLEKIHAQIATAEDGQQAFEIANTRQFDLIIVDLQMPRMNGFEATRKIRDESLFNRSTPILAVSANINKEDQDQLRELGINVWLQKPVQERELMKVIKSLEVHKHKAIDWNQCIQLMAGKPEKAREILDVFMVELLKAKEGLQQAYQAQDFEQLKNQAHKLHGSCCYLGVPELKKAAFELERCLQEGDQSQIKSHYTILMQTVACVVGEYSVEYAEG